MKKVSSSLAHLTARGLIGSDEAARVAVLAELSRTLTEAGSAVSSAELLEGTGVSAQALTVHMGHLSSLGFAIQSMGNEGYRLVRPFDNLLLPEAVVPLLLESQSFTREESVGLPYRYQASCESTNVLLKTDAAVLPAGTLEVTDNQTQGRGRLGRSWCSEAGEDLTFSVLLRPSLSPAEAPLLSLAAALATAEVLELLPGLAGRVWVKWPNDVLIDQRKVCGILLESSLAGEHLQWVVAGIGLNVNSDPCACVAALRAMEREAWRGRPQPTSLRVEVGHEVPRGRLLADLVARLQCRWLETDKAALFTQLTARDALRGRRLEVFAGPPDGALLTTGEAVGLGPQGELLVRGSDGVTVPVFAGEVTVSVDSPAA